MDHDSVTSDLQGPASARAADVRAFCAEFTRRGLLRMGRLIRDDPSYESNASGHFAWDVSLAVRAAIMAWRVTGDPSNLRQGAEWARHLVENTDAATGRRDWRGRSRPVWSAGARYTAGRALVTTVGAIPIHLQASATHVIIERPGPTTAVIGAVVGGETVWSSPVASLLPGGEDYLPDVLARRSGQVAVLVRGLALPADLTAMSAGSYALEEQFAPHLVHTAMIARSLLAASEALTCAGPGGVAVDLVPGDLVVAAEDALLSHDQELRTRRGQTWYITPEDFPGRRLGLELPHNHVVDAATSFLILGRTRRDPGLRDLGRSLARRFIAEAQTYQDGDLRHPWHYYPVDSDTFSGVERETPVAERHVRGVSRAEDSSHATLRARALGEWRARDAELVPDELLRSIALSFRRHFLTARGGVPTIRWLPGERADAPRGGRADTYAGAWSALAMWDSSLKRRINSLTHHHPPTSVFGGTLLSAAEVLALNSGVSIDVAGGQTALA